MEKIAKTYKCVFCGAKYTGFGHNAAPVKSGRCCTDCHRKYVYDARRELGEFVNAVKEGDVIASPDGWLMYVFTIEDKDLPAPLRGRKFLAVNDADYMAVEKGALPYGGKLRLLTDINLYGYTIYGHYDSPNFNDGSAQAGREWYANNAGFISWHDCKYSPVTYR